MSINATANIKEPLAHRRALDWNYYLICVLITTVCVLGWCWVAYDFSKSTTNLKKRTTRIIHCIHTE